MKHMTYSDNLFVKQDLMSGAILFASTDGDKFEALERLFKRDYPDIKDTAVWETYENRIMPTSVEAIRKGASCIQHLVDYHSCEKVDFKQYIFEVELIYAELDAWVDDRNTYQFSTTRKANEFVAKKIAEDKDLEINRVNLYLKTLDTNERELIKKWSRHEDKYARMRKVKEAR